MTDDLDGARRLLESDKGHAVARDENQYTPLHFVQSAAMVDLLVAHSGDVNAEGLDGMSTLTCAINNASALKELLKHGADPNATDKAGMNSVFAILMQPKPKAEILKVLIDAGANINATDMRGETVLDRVDRLDDSPRKVKLEKMIIGFGGKRAKSRRSAN
jgi:ankyrin repeat protein